ncbi:SRPBCC domain-containing protein [Mycolicibacterium frederiksbergense]|uniref:SRPBCC domain-containing protein n=1 Tax=Mycolicibacterium frederiksbergense TaxID=117567 RepID=UPI00399A8829
MDTLDITRSIDIAAPITKVWSALTEADLIAQWLGDSAEFEAVAGGTGYFGWPAHGKFRVLVEQAEKPRLLVYRWAREADTDPVPGNSTMVRIELFEIDGGTRLALVESGFEQLHNAEAAHAENQGGWTAELGELVEFLTSAS